MVTRLKDQPTVVVLGGAGGMGKMAARIVSSYQDLGQLIIADMDLPAAKALVAELTPSAATNLRAVHMDVTDGPALRELLGQADVLLNTTGPFYKLGTVVLEAAISARCHYIDICDDWEPTIELLNYSEKAKAAGVLAIIGLGASPGVSNLLARVACERLDQVDDLYTAWPIDAGSGDFSLDLESDLGADPSAAIVHWAQQISGSIDVIENGLKVSRPPQVPVTLNYPGLGSGTAYTVGHPEPITLHERMNVQNHSANLMVLQRTTAAYVDQVRKEVDADRLSASAAARALSKPRIGRYLRATFAGLTMKSAGKLPGFFAYAKGQRGGLQMRIGVHVKSMPSGMGAMTSTPLALGLRQLLNEGIQITGVHPPESVININPFFDEFARACQTPLTGKDELLIVHEAVDS